MENIWQNTLKSKVYNILILTQFEQYLAPHHVTEQIQLEHNDVKLKYQILTNIF